MFVYRTILALFSMSVLIGCVDNEMEVKTYRVAKKKMIVEESSNNPHQGMAGGAIPGTIGSAAGDENPHAVVGAAGGADDSMANVTSGDMAEGVKSGLVSNRPEVASNGLSWTTPKEWTEKKGSGMRVVSFQIPGTGGKADASIIILGSAARGVEANVNRWRGQVDLPSISESEILSASEKLTTGVGSAQFFKIINPLKLEDGILASMIDRNDSVIFVKAKGAAATLGEQESNFKKFVKSLK